MDKAKVLAWIAMIAIVLAATLYLLLEGTRNGRTSKVDDTNDRSIRLTAEFVDIDINSGDLRCRDYSSGELVKTTISETTLSQEVRRLRIEVPSNRDWRLVSSRQFEGAGLVSSKQPERAAYVDGKYGFAASLGNRLVQVLDETYAPDEDRRAKLTKFMRSLRADDWEQAQQVGESLIMEASRG